MFDAIRNRSRILMGVLVLLIIPSFVLLGVDGYSNRGEQGAVVAKVADMEITQQEWNAVHQQEVDRIRASVPDLDAKLLGSDEARYATLERMVNDRLISATAQKQLLITSDQRLANYLQQDPSIASLRGPDGKLDMVRYRQLAASQGMTPEMFEGRVRRNLSDQQVMSTLQASALASRQQTDNALQAYLQRREIQIQQFDAQSFVSQIQVTEADLERLYQAQSRQFRTQESADVEYLVLDAAVLAQNIDLPEQDVRTYYEQNLQRLAGQEQRRASHILIEAPQDAPEAVRAQARDKAEALLADLRQTPSKFAELAEQHSDDPGSASNGGDLDFFAKGAMVKAFEDAAFALQKGEISPVVVSEFGFHIIQLTDIQQPDAPSLESMREQLVADLRNQQALRQFAEYAETFSNSVYEQADTFKPVAEQLNLTIEQAQNVSKFPAIGLTGVLANPQVVEALFAEDSVIHRRNTAAIEVGNNTMVSVRIVNHRPAAVRPFAEVKDLVRAQYVREQSLVLAKAEGQKQLTAWQSNADKAQMGPALVVSRDQSQTLDPTLLEAALRADPAKLPAWVGVDLGEQGYAVVRINKLVARDAPDAQQLLQSREQFAQLLGNAEAAAYLSHLRAQFKVEILVPKPQPFVAL